jgi:hypothetical protein
MAHNVQVALMVVNLFGVTAVPMDSNGIKSISAIERVQSQIKTLICKDLSM